MRNKSVTGALGVTTMEELRWGRVTLVRQVVPDKPQFVPENTGVAVGGANSPQFDMIQLTAKRAVFSKMFSNQLLQQSALNKSVEAVGVWSAAEEWIHDVRRWTDSTLAFFAPMTLAEN